MSQSYPIWNDVTACIYKSNRSWGARDVSNVTVNVGSSASNSTVLCSHQTTRKKVFSKNLDQWFYVFKFYVNNVCLVAAIFYEEKGRPGKLYKHYDKTQSIKSLNIEL